MESHTTIFLSVTLFMWHQIVYNVSTLLSNFSTWSSIFAIASADKNKDTLKKYEDLRGKTLSDQCRKRNWKIRNVGKSNFDDDLSLKKTLEFYNIIVALGSVFHEDNYKC